MERTKRFSIVYLFCYQIKLLTNQREEKNVQGFLIYEYEMKCMSWLNIQTSLFLKRLEILEDFGICRTIILQVAPIRQIRRSVFERMLPVLYTFKPFEKQIRHCDCY